MNKLRILLVVLLVIGTLGNEAAAGSFGPESVRGRYTGNVVVSENFSDGTTPFQIEARLLLALTFDGKSNAAGVASVTVAVPGQVPFTCPFSATGQYDMGEEGLGTATIDLVPASVGCGGDGNTGVKLKMSLLVGGHNRSRLDITLDGAETKPDGQPLPLVGSGALSKL